MPDLCGAPGGQIEAHASDRRDDRIGVREDEQPPMAGGCCGTGHSGRRHDEFAAGKERGRVALLRQDAECLPDPGGYGVGVEDRDDRCRRGRG
ncbi:hypothetical protein [Kitasatospora phosalacinea]|uniref:Uncharacterized protein n=1 Tax=Kitasatospora phosalacinea TaxID=2065 RepID=A0ABW6GJU5_9ACTN